MWIKVSCKILNVRSGAELPEKCRELALHFETQGTPVMIGYSHKLYLFAGLWIHLNGNAFSRRGSSCLHALGS